MNIRRQLYKKYRIEGMSAYRSAVKAGYAHATAWNAHKNIEKRCDFGQLLVKHGLDDDTLLKKIVDGLDSNKLVAADIVIRNDNGEMQVNKNSNDWVEYPDQAVRHKFIETALKLNGRLKDRVEHSGAVKTGETKIIFVTPKERLLERNPQTLSI
jgi:hypothetical protein